MPNGFSNTVVPVEEDEDGEGMDEDTEHGKEDPKPKGSDWDSIESFDKLLAMVATSSTKGKGKGQQEGG